MPRKPQITPTDAIAQAVRLVRQTGKTATVVITLQGSERAAPIIAEVDAALHAQRCRSRVSAEKKRTFLDMRGKVRQEIGEIKIEIMPDDDRWAIALTYRVADRTS